MHNLDSINPFYAARQARRSPVEAPIRRTLYAKLPLAPITGSPVPELTSLYHSATAGNYGDRKYPGNCPGNLIRDLLRYFQPTSVFDPMTGSGTCRDVARELPVECWSGDIHAGFDLCDPRNFYGEEAVLGAERFEFAWLHPPY